MFERIGRMIDVALAAFWRWYWPLHWTVRISLAFIATSLISGLIAAKTGGPIATYVCQLSLINSITIPVFLLLLNLLRDIAAWVGWQMDHPKHSWGLPLCMLGFFGLLWEMTDEATLRQVAYWYGTCFALILSGWTINRIGPRHRAYVRDYTRSQYE